jgi:hypothetical protein
MVRFVGGLRCVDGSSLQVIPVPSHDRGGTTFEVTLELRRDGESFGSVGERCGFFLADLTLRLARARAETSPQARLWPDPDDRFPGPDGFSREPELFAFRHRDRGDRAGTGELRCWLRTSSLWMTGREEEGPDGPYGSWRIARRAVLEAWGASGRGVRAVLTSGELSRFLHELLEEAAHAGANYGDLMGDATAGRSRR